MWEVEDNKAAPSNLVREQDFILSIRRFHRLGVQRLVVNITLSAIDADYRGRGPLEEVQQRLQTFIESTGGSYAEMSSGDVFLMWPESPAARQFPDQIMKIVLPEGGTDEDNVKFRFVFRLPEDYGQLRERANDYIEASRTAATEQKASGAAQALQDESVRGPLTSWTVYQIQKLLNDISIRSHIRRQPVYARDHNGKWAPLWDECFVALNELHRTYFPKLEFETPNHLFLEMCQSLDRRLITGLTRNYELIKGQKLSLNLSVMSVVEAAFTHFSRMLPITEHNLIGFEVHVGDLFQDIDLTLNALATIRREGFKVGLDGITPDMLPYINFPLFNVDFFKINASKAHAGELGTPTARKIIASLPLDKIVFFHCDSAPALVAGTELGVKMFQGWLIDDSAKEEEGKV
jgi:EAL domain-containing protein (putative c-di-GMP-specific phosphodiesterase class I)